MQNDTKLGMHTHIGGKGENLEMTEVAQTQTTEKITESDGGDCENREMLDFSI